MLLRNSVAPYGAAVRLMAIRPPERRLGRGFWGVGYPDARDRNAGYRDANQVLAGRAARWLLVTASVQAGLLLAVLTIDRAGAWAGFLGSWH